MNTKAMVKDIEYQRTWCDDLTHCPYFTGIEVGSYECCVECPFHVGREEHKRKEFDACDYSRYFEIITGIVKCKYNEEDI